MIKLTCLLRRKPGMSPQAFHAHWRNVHGPLVAGSQSGSYALRYVQHHRSLASYSADDTGYDGVTEQWFASMATYHASVAAPDFADLWRDMESFLDTDRLEFVLTEEPAVIVEGDASLRSVL